jgi:hypothetical protein
MADVIGNISWNGKPVREQVVIPLIGTVDDWIDHMGVVNAIQDPANPSNLLMDIGLIWDDSDDMLFDVGLVFNAAKWQEPDANKWTTDNILAVAADEPVASAALATLRDVTRRLLRFGSGSDAAKPIDIGQAEMIYLRRLVSNLRKALDPALYEQAVTEARAHAGGVMRGVKAQEGQQELPGATEDADVGEVTTDAETEPQNGTEPVVPAIAASAKAPMASQAYAWAPEDLPKPYQDEAGDIWKCVSRAGMVYQPFSGESCLITREILQAVVQSFGKAYQYVDVPIGHEWDSPDKNTGFIREVRLEEHPKGLRLWALFHFTEPDIKEKVLRGTIADCSIWIDNAVLDMTNGTDLYEWALAHVCLTNKPLMTNLGAFTAAPKIGYKGQVAQLYTSQLPEHSGKGARTMAAKFEVSATVEMTTPHDLAATGAVYFVAEVREGENAYALASTLGDRIEWFLEDEIQAADPATLADMSGSPAVPGLSAQHPVPVGQLSDMTLNMALQRRGFSLDGLGKMVAANRGARVNAIKLALEGKEPLDGVTIVPGTRHHPSVVAAVVKLLQEEPTKRKFAVDMDGACVQVDELVLAVVNAIPAEQRFKEPGFSIPRHEAPLHGDATTETAEQRRERLAAIEATLPGSKAKKNGAAKKNGSAPDSVSTQ